MNLDEKVLVNLPEEALHMVLNVVSLQGVVNPPGCAAEFLLLFHQMNLKPRLGNIQCGLNAGDSRADHDNFWPVTIRLHVWPNETVEKQAERRSTSILGVIHPFTKDGVDYSEP